MGSDARVRSLFAARGNLDMANKAANTTKKSIGEFMKKKEKPPDALFAEKAQNEADIKDLEEKLKDLAVQRDDAVGQIGARVPARHVSLLTLSSPRRAVQPTQASPTPSFGSVLLPQATSSPTRCPWTTRRTTTW